MSKAIQDLYQGDFAVCYGCGKNNPEGYQLKTYLEGDETVTRFRPDAKYTAIPGSVYGGLVASVMDCHGTGSAAIFVCLAEDISMEGESIPVRCVTASLTVNFKAPTPIATELEARGKLKKIEGRKVWVELTLSANGQVCCTGEILAIRLKENA